MSHRPVVMARNNQLNVAEMSVVPAKQPKISSSRSPRQWGK